MNDSRSNILAFEAKWSVRTGLVTLLAVAFLIAAAVIVSSVNGDGEAELLRAATAHSGDVTLSATLEAFGFLLLLAPLYFFFRAVAARSPQVRRQLVGLIIAAPIFFAASALLNAAATNEAADQFAAGEAKSTLTAKDAASDCKSDLQDKGAKDFNEEFDAGASPQADCVTTKVADDEATNALSEATYRGLGTGFGLGGRLGLAIALLYSCLWGMRTGLVSRFWGSLGMALGVAALLLLVQFTMIWFVYLALLLIGRIPGGRPPAWAAGEAIPWPTPGQRAAESLEPMDPDVIDVDPVDAPDPGDPADPGNGNGSGAGPRKRKRRS